MMNAFSARWGALRRKKRGFSWSIVALLLCGCALVAANTPPVTSPFASKLTGGATFSALSGLAGRKSPMQNFYLNNYTISNVVNNYLQGATVFGGATIGTVTNSIIPRKVTPSAR